MSLREYQKIKGIGLAKAISIKAALELSARVLRAENNEINKIMNSGDAYKFLKPIFYNLTHEEFWVICLNKKNEVISKIKIGVGNDKYVLVDIKDVISTITEVKAFSFLCAHNHPGGTKEPSQQDITLTKNILEASRYVQIKFADHIIFCGDGFYSFKDADRIDF
jgi:DNA repair protein RadC